MLPPEVTLIFLDSCHGVERFQYRYGINYVAKDKFTKNQMKTPIASLIIFSFFPCVASAAVVVSTTF